MTSLLVELTIFNSCRSASMRLPRMEPNRNNNGISAKHCDISLNQAGRINKINDNTNGRMRFSPYHNYQCNEINSWYY